MLAAFQPQGNTSLIAVTTAPSAPMQPSTGSIIGARLINASTNTVFISFGASTATAALPTTSVAGSIPLLQNTDRVFNFMPNYWLSAATSAGTANLYITPGFGQ